MNVAIPTLLLQEAEGGNFPMKSLFNFYSSLFITLKNWWVAEWELGSDLGKKNIPRIYFFQEV